MYSYRILNIIVMLIISMSCNEKKLEPISQVDIADVRRVVTVKIRNYCPGFENSDSTYHDNMKRSHVFLINLSAVSEKGVVYEDFDRDGVPSHKDQDVVLGITRTSADSYPDGYRDLLIYYAGFTLEQQNNFRRCDAFIGNTGIVEDTDIDGLNDCEEKLLRTDPNDFDTDNDGVPDYLEVRNGMEPRPTDKDDTILDPDMDGFNNLEEVQMNTPLTESNNKNISKIALQYKTMRLLTRTDHECYDYTISNIFLSGAAEGNILRLYLIEKDRNNSSNKLMRVYDIAVSKSTETGTEFLFDYGAGELSVPEHHVGTSR